MTKVVSAGGRLLNAPQRRSGTRLRNEHDLADILARFHELVSTLRLGQRQYCPDARINRALCEKTDNRSDVVVDLAALGLDELVDSVQNNSGFAPQLGDCEQQAKTRDIG